MEQSFLKGKYKVTNDSFEYLGHKEPLSQVADLEVLEADSRQKLVAGLTLSFWGLLFSFFPGFLFTIVLPELVGDSVSPQLANSAICVTVFFFLGIVLRPKYRLMITKVSGNKGAIGKSRKSRAEFDEIVAALKESMYRNL
ncbi:hypothetical protein [Vibrio parahaemolyticus]|uniref:hypothetical protein n=1 Tax=Vibrio parahaemolyticus TaxID=670 RepID=UPI00111C94C5|nr:hypothetical protein [Vibrio parahaemolyticus]EIO5099276.1 hypothetical protein [Vibrio parahaemolyticus]MDF4490085.1 hypothetical protein [Vibrio parahaemolyticus]MDG3384660.1 hypothetical protein [Vibrio parahaemolyticus]TOL28829.1 hypothetical protein CGI01_23930 [Vibrio parahaemolyticus]